MHQRKTIAIILGLLYFSNAEPVCASMRFDPQTGKLSGHSGTWTETGSGWGSYTGCTITMYTPRQWYQVHYDIGAGSCDSGDRDTTWNWLRTQIQFGVILTKGGTNTEDLGRVGLRVGDRGIEWSIYSRDVQISETVSCKIEGPMVLDHGTISEKEAQGHTAGTQVELECDGPADVVVTGRPRNIKMTNGMISKILVNGKAQSKVHVGDGPASIDISSTLSGSVSQPGAATGTGVIQYEVQ